ncbi:DNA mismatch repair protein MutS [Caloramator sp.]|uniref:DNA mismatch repair protein MutS n=1 Tax=Caloramator sp. TaxID=1871330 RepID=UPI0025BCB78E|nr:DNA mismatch repair protein MutS [Caloramator sp.]
MGLTPMMQQYLEIKQSCQDCILFFRLGDFYEMFFEDAKIVSQELELTLTGRDCGLEERAPMCGVPYHSAETYISKLIEKGYKVAICEQVEDPNEAKGIVRREIVKIVTPGTLLEGNLLEDDKNNYISCIKRINTGFSISICDVSTGDFLVTSMENNNIYIIIDELFKYKPSEILIIDVKNNDILINSIKEKFNSLIELVDESQNFTEFKNHFGEKINILNELELGSSSTLFEYLKNTQKSMLGNINDIIKYQINNYMLLDSSTRRNLELTETIINKTKKGSLFWILDKTQTSMGARNLRRWIEAPLTDITEIKNRIDAVEELINNIYHLDNLRESLKKIYDIERLVSKIVYGSANARDLVSLKNSISELPNIKVTLQSFKSNLLKGIYTDFDTLEDIYNLIDLSIDNNPPISIKEGNIIKKGYNKEVDKYRLASIEGKNWIASLEQKEKEATGIKSLKVGYNKVFGYYIEVTKANLSNIPEDRYIRKQTLSNAERFITPELKEIENTILNAEDNLLKLEYELFVDIRNKISNQSSRIQKVAKQLAILDTIQSFAKVSIENNYTKPSLNNDGIISLKEARHPVIEKMINEPFVPNDCFIDKSNNMILIITGPNMAGKSTFMRQVAIISLMAQIGCYVPAKSANLPIVDKIFTRIGASDDISSGKSTFMVEMSEVSYILKNATSNSLLILDEVGRGTSTFDGLSIAWSVVEYIANKIKAKTLFATHYHELTELEDKYSCIKNYSIEVKEFDNKVIFLHKIKRGKVDQSYGIEVAKLAGLPDEVILNAKVILSELENSKEIHISKNILNDKLNYNNKIKENEKEIAAEKMELTLFNYKENEIINEIKELDILNMTPMQAFNYIYDLVNRVKKIRS